MGQKTHPTSLRIGITENWRSRWFAKKDYRNFLHEDIFIRETIRKNFPNAGISRIEIERTVKEVTILIHTSRPGVLIGRSGTSVTELKNILEKKIKNKKIRIEVLEIENPEADAFLVAENIVRQIEQRIPYSRVVKRALEKALSVKGVKGVKIVVKGRLGGAEIARSETFLKGKIPLHTLKANIDFAEIPAQTSYGTVGVKVWIYKDKLN